MFIFFKSIYELFRNKIISCLKRKMNRKEMFYLTTHSTHFLNVRLYDIWLRTILIVRKETRCRHIGYSFRLTARVLLYAPSHRQDSTYHGFVTPVVVHWLEREIAQWVHPMKDRSDDPSHHERTLLPRSYILLRKMNNSSISYNSFHAFMTVRCQHTKTTEKIMPGRVLENL